MLLTSSQVSVLFSTGVIITFTSALFLAGYVLQQQTVRSLQMEIKPRVSRIHTRFSASVSASSLSEARAKATVTPAALPVHAQAQLSAPLLFGDPAPVVSHATPAPRLEPARQARLVLDGGSNILDSWKDRERLSEEAAWSRGRERFESEGEDFFAPDKDRKKSKGIRPEI